MRKKAPLKWNSREIYTDATRFNMLIVMLLVFFRSLFFGDYMVPDSAERIYDEVTDITLLTQQMEGYVNIYYSLCCFIAKNRFWSSWIMWRSLRKLMFQFVVVLYFLKVCFSRASVTRASRVISGI